MRAKKTEPKYGSVKEWLESTERRTNVVHTIENGKPVRATRLEDGTWEIVQEPWQHGKG